MWHLVHSSVGSAQSMTQFMPQCDKLIGKSPSEFMISQLPESRTQMKLKCKPLPRGQSKNLPMKSHFHENYHLTKS
ncbi:hypothetical protein QL285_094525 [Trifolium repens]|nr:hypothetical protein QL285_094525 [Trifolium repens]